MNEETILQRAGRALIAATDYEASFYEGQGAVERWALDAFEAALNGDEIGAKRLLDRYEHEEDWDVRVAYYGEDEQ